MAKARFKLSFRQTEVWAGGEKRRALILAVSPTPMRGWLQAILAVDDGSMQQKAISIPDFELAERHTVALIEADEVAAPTVNYAVEKVTT